MTTITCDNVNIGWAPYVWKLTGTDATSRSEAGMPGAYLKLWFGETTAAGLLIDGTANEDCPAQAMPVVEFSVDHGPFKSMQIMKTGRVDYLPLAEGLDIGKQHHVEFILRAAALAPDRWEASTVHLCIAGVQLDTGGILLPSVLRSGIAIGFGDSIMEGVLVDGLCDFYSNLFMNNARCTWFPMVCEELGCEYGQLGTGGQGMVKTIEMPPLPKTWDRHDPVTSRLTEGLLLPEPDYMFCGMGTNDFEGDAFAPRLLDIKDAYIGWLISARNACPNTRIFCITPPLGWHTSEIAEAVAARNADGDGNVALIDTSRLKAGFDVEGATQLAVDGVHPSLYGNALLAILVAAQVRKVLEK